MSRATSDILMKYPDGTVRKVGVINRLKKYVILPKKRSIHFFRKSLSWSINENLLRELSKGNFTIYIKELESMEFFSILAVEWFNKGSRDTFGEHGVQVFLEETEFRKSRKLLRSKKEVV